MDVVRSLADRIIVLHNGKLVADGKPAEVIASPVVQEAYLGYVGREGRMSALLSLSGVETHIARYHILHGVDLDVPRPPTMLPAATARARRPHCAPSWACGARRRGSRSITRELPTVNLSKFRDATHVANINTTGKNVVWTSS